MNIYLVRHGEKKPEEGDPGLTDAGKKQAKKLGNYFKDKKIEKLISSPSKRAIETSEIIAVSIKSNFDIENNLRERLNFGEIKGQTYNEYLTEVYKSTLDRDYKLQNGETSKEKGKKIEVVIKNNFKVKNLLLVFHGGSIADFLRNHFNDEFLSAKSKYFERDKTVESGSITVLKYNKNKIVIATLNFKP